MHEARAAPHCASEKSSTRRNRCPTARRVAAANVTSVSSRSSNAGRLSRAGTRTGQQSHLCLAAADCARRSTLGVNRARSCKLRRGHHLNRKKLHPALNRLREEQKVALAQLDPLQKSAKLLLRGRGSGRIAQSCKLDATATSKRQKDALYAERRLTKRAKLQTCRPQASPTGNKLHICSSPPTEIATSCLSSVRRRVNRRKDAF